MSVLVAGGAGYIGSHMTRALLRHGRRVIVVDNFSKGRRPLLRAAAAGREDAMRLVEAGIADRALLVDVLRNEGVEAVMHFAAFIEVGESLADPRRYYENNVLGSLSLLDAMLEADVRKIVFSSTAAVYGNPALIPITEEQTPAPISPYGRSKLMVERAI